MDTKERFLNDTKEHVLTIHQDEGVYRHLRMGIPGASEYHYTLTTWPNHLCISGDMGTYVFSRLHDMFQFFKSDDLTINTHYWAEKCLSEDKASRGMKEFDREYFLGIIKGYVDGWEYDSEGERESEWISIQVQIDESVGCENTAYLFTRDYEPDEKYSDHIFQDIDGDFQKYTSSFEWILYAIVHGIQTYQKAKAESDPDAADSEETTMAMR